MNTSVRTAATLRHRAFAVVASLALGLTLVGATTTPAHAAKKPSVTVKAPAKATVGTKVKITVTVARGVAKQKLTVQHRVKGKWTKVAARKLAASKKAKRTLTFTVAPRTTGTHVYRAVLAKRKKLPKTVSAPVSIRVAKKVSTPPPDPDPDPDPTEGFTLTTSSKTSGEDTTVTFNGALAGHPAGTAVTLQYSWGSKPGASGWLPATTVTTGEDTTYSGTAVVSWARSAADKGAPQLNLRAVAGKALSPTKAYLIRTVFEGFYSQYLNGEPVSQDTFYVDYSSRSWYMNFGTIRVSGVTDGWDLVDNAGLRFKATYRPPGKVCSNLPAPEPPACRGDDRVPWIEFEASWGAGESFNYIEGTARYQV